MKKKEAMKFLLVLVFIGIFMGLYEKEKILLIKDTIKYELLINNFEKIDDYNLERINTNEDVFIYFGSRDCPYCIKNANNIKAISKEYKKMNYSIYYYEVNLYSISPTFMYDSYKDNYEFETIPHILIFSNDNIESINSSQIDILEIDSD